MDRRGPAQGCPHCHLAVFVGLATHDDGATDAAFLHEQPDGMFLCGNNGFLVDVRPSGSVCSGYFSYRMPRMKLL